MNTPLPSAVPSTNVVLKEDTSAASSSSTGGNIFKTATGEVTLSLSPPDNANASLVSLNQVAFSQFFSSETASPFLQEFSSHNLVFLTPEMVDIEIQLSDLLQALENMETQETQIQNTSPSVKTSDQQKPASSNTTLNKKDGSISPKETPRSSSKNNLSSSLSKSIRTQESSSSPISFSSLRQSSSLSKLPFATQPQRTQKENEQPSIKLSTTPAPLLDKKHETIAMTKSQESQQNQKHREHQQEKQKDQQEDKDQDEHHNKKNSRSKVTKIQENSLGLSVVNLRYASDIRQTKQQEVRNEDKKTFQRKPPSPMSLFTAKSPSSLEFQPIQTPKIENVFVSFMRLMARILGQAEAEAHELYLRVKERTDNVDKLTLLLSKINAEKGEINWEKNAEMKALVDQVKKLDVTIDNNTYCWSEEEKKLLKENIQMRKENMEKITQLERTDMQRYLQEVSQCHQARSNVLKLLKELMDTFIYNLRP
ncbi:hypothetical protein [Chlamydia avium]|uniref:Uncharacterized protein n=1 Tax=Chlamydia avium TaxID=1457141 RepID=A0ABN0MS26_9CHLA|nr:hypothetical protein [Chlamydia avium]EPP38290.1 hypothetical protein CP10881SC42_0924 [Chlamydia avium]